ARPRRATPWLARTRARGGADGESGAAEGGVHALLTLWRLAQVGERRLVCVWRLEGLHELLEGLEIVAKGGRGDDLFDAVIARNEGRVRATHRACTYLRRGVCRREPSPPNHRPIVERPGVGEERRHLGVRRRVERGRAEAAKEERVVHLVRREALQQIGGERQIVFVLAREAELCAQDVRVRGLEDRGEAIELRGCEANGFVLVLAEGGQERLGQSHEVPLGD